MDGDAIHFLIAHLGSFEVGHVCDMGSAQQVYVAVLINDDESVLWLAKGYFRDISVCQAS